jgi:hypothetical protein
MFVGHLQRSVYCQNGENQIPLWGLFVAVQLLDFLWAPLFFLGLEKARIVPGITAVSPLDHREAEKQKKEEVEMIVCVSPNPNDIARLLDYSVNFTAR